MESRSAMATREARLAQEAALTPEERVMLSLKLGHRACVMYAAGQGLTLHEARAALNARKLDARRR